MRAEVIERLKIMEEGGMISREVVMFCTRAAELILREKPDAEADKLNMLITHLALAGNRMEKKDETEMAISREVLDGVKREKVYTRACVMSRRILTYTKLEFAEPETELLTVHLCNILM